MERFTKNSVDLETSIFSILENYFSSLLAICIYPIKQYAICPLWATGFWGNLMLKELM